MRALALNLLLALALPLAHAANDTDTVGTYLTPGTEREELAQRFTGRNAVVIASVPAPALSSMLTILGRL